MAGFSGYKKGMQRIPTTTHPQRISCAGWISSQSDFIHAQRGFHCHPALPVGYSSTSVRSHFPCLTKQYPNVTFTISNPWTMAYTGTIPRGEYTASR